MTRSKLRKIRRNQAKQARAFLTGVPLAGAMLVGAPVVQAQQAEEQTSGLDEVVVTALKTQQNLQDVPVSIQAIGTERLEELNITSFDDYVKYLPSVSYQSAGPGFARVFMRGAAAGDNGNHSGPQPGVGQYLDEQPITTIQGALDIHMYDIARVEALAGPQGTLYGASSQSGTIRIITNKPDKSGFEGGFSLEGNTIADGDLGLSRRRLREHSARRKRRHSPRGMGAPRWWLHRQRGRHAHLPDFGHLAWIHWPKTTTTTPTPMARAPRSGSTSTTTGASRRA